jgi:hypothetical protein
VITSHYCDPSSKTLAVRNLARIREFNRAWHQARVFAEKNLFRPSSMSTQLQQEQPQLQGGAKLGEKNWAEISRSLLGRISEALDMSFEKKEEISDRLVVFIIDAYPLFEGLPVPSAIPVIFAGEAPLTLSQIEVIRSYLIAHQTELGKMALLSVLGSPETISRVRTMVRNKIRDPFAFDVIVLGKQNWLDFFTSSESQAAFRKLVLSEFDLRTLSPFVISGPALDNMFFGREHELREITERITTSNYILIGGRRMGKTSILKRLERVHLPAADFCALYHDCSYTSNLRELTEAISRDKSWFTQPPAIDPTSFADIVTALPQEDDIVILFDEADGILAADQNADYKFSTTLRAMANKGYCRFVLSGGRALHTEIANPDSPLYNFGNEILVGRLDFHDVEELIIQPIEQLEIKLEDKNGIVKQIWSLTSGHPNIVQRFCQRLIVRLNNRRDRDLSMGDIEAVATDQDFLRKDFLNVYWERATVLDLDFISLSTSRGLS